MLLAISTLYGCRNSYECVPAANYEVIRDEAQTLVELYESSGQSVWKVDEIPMGLEVIRAIRPLQAIIVGGDESRGYEVDVRMQGGFRHRGIVIVVGVGTELDEFHPARGVRQGWKNRKLTNRIFEYQE